MTRTFDLLGREGLSCRRFQVIEAICSHFRWQTADTCIVAAPLVSTRGPKHMVANHDCGRSTRRMGWIC